MSDLLERVDDTNWESFISSSAMAVLLVTETTCPHCKNWKSELSQYLAGIVKHEDCRFGVVSLDGEGVEAFKKANDAWIRVIDGFPFNVIYVHGEPKTSFYGGGVERMIKRIARHQPGE
ncbi:MAG: hypothetical protein KJ645_09685 [Planctomycetes bacterium]|nr:hypothetical protein [Planctomycetota bacterium]